MDSLKSFSESKGISLFDWNLFLKIAKENKLTEKRFLEAQKCAMDWVTCACGNQCDIIPRNDIGVPIDSELMILGLNFTGFILEKKWNEATQTLKNIESRSAYLIEEIRKEAHNG